MRRVSASMLGFSQEGGGGSGRRQVRKKAGGERIATLTRLCIHCLPWEEDFGSGLVDVRAWEAERWDTPARVRA